MANDWIVTASNYVMDENRVRLTVPPARPLKITGTRFSAVLGRDRFKTPFAVWCELTRVAKCRFVETPRLKAGRVVEQSLVTALKDWYPCLGLRHASECSEFTDNPYDYFPNQPIFGGKWDAMGTDLMVEIKTTAAKNARYWMQGTPEQHILQTALYAYLARCNRFIIACSFLEDRDYEQPESFKPELCAGRVMANSVYREFKLDEILPDFECNYVQRALAFWEEYVVTGVSPEYTEQDIRSGLVTLLEEGQAVQQQPQVLTGNFRATTRHTV